ncbi:hypothetical protein ACSBR1_039988 [Camellia fascicularis]
MEQIKPIQVKVMQFYDEIYQIQVLQAGKSSNGVPSMENNTMVEEEIKVGFDGEALTIKEQLAGGKKQLHIISIVGMPGLGKTTLARKLYNDPYITQYFRIRAWTYVSQAKSCIGTLRGRDISLSLMIFGTLVPGSILKCILPNDDIGSRVMFTSRHREVAMHASLDSQPHCIRFHDEEESWELFQWKVFQKESCPSELIEIGKQIMKKCKGLPLAIVVIAGLLAKNKKTKECWKQVSQSVSSYIVSDPNQYLDTLALSYNHLPRHLKPCFLYLGAFPEDQEISV